MIIFPKPPSRQQHIPPCSACGASAWVWQSSDFWMRRILTCTACGHHEAYQRQPGSSQKEDLG